MHHLADDVDMSDERLPSSTKLQCIVGSSSSPSKRL